MTDSALQSATGRLGEYRFVLIGSFLALAITSIPYLLGAALATEERVFGGFVYAVEDCYSYLAKMRQGAEGAWLFHIAYTPEPHPGALFFPFHLLLGKLAQLLSGGNLTSSMIWTYHVARWVFGLGLLLTVYRFLAAFTRRTVVRRLAWVMVTFGGGLGWLLIALGQADWLGSIPLDFILPEGFTFLVLYAFPHIALGRTLLLGGLLWLFKAWQLNHVTGDPGRVSGSASRLSSVGPAVVAGLLWLLMGLVVPFYVAVAWAIVGAGWIVLAVRERLAGRRLRPLGFPMGRLMGAGSRTPAQESAPRATSQNPKGLAIPEPLLLLARRLPWGRAVVAGIAALVSAPIVVYSAWRFTSHPVYGAWASQNRILSPHPLHYLAAYGVPLALAGFAVKDAWHSKRPTCLTLAWVGVVPFLIYLPFNLQRRLVEGVQVPLSLLAAIGLTKITNPKSKTPNPNSSECGRCGSTDSAQKRVGGAALRGTWRRLSLRSRLAVSIVLLALVLSNAVLIVGNTIALQGLPAPIFRDSEEVAALDWLSQQVAPDDVVLASYETGNYLPAHVGARAFVGHGPESVRAAEKKALAARFFRGATEDTWRQHLLTEYEIDYVFWGPQEHKLGAFDPGMADYLQPIYGRSSYLLFEVVQ
jgi:hypothetical protein